MPHFHSARRAATVRLTGALTIFSALAAGLPGAALAQNYPSRPIRMVIPYTPGGFTDQMGRLIGEPLARVLGQPVVFDNKPGANSMIGADMVAKAAPDGYTIGTVIAAHSVNPSLYSKMPFDAVKDFTQVSVIGVSPLILTANKDAPFNNIRELIAYAKANPNKLSYGSSGIGAAAHLGMEYFNSLTGLKMTHVPYKGTAPALTDLIGGQIQLMWDTPSSMVPHVKSGKIKAIAMASAKRIRYAPDVPTVDESGLPGFQAATWAMLMAPAGTPAAIVDRLSKEADKALKSSAIVALMDEKGVVPGGGTPAQAKAFLESEIAKWSKVIKERGITVDQPIR